MTFPGLSQGDFDLESALAECVDAEGRSVWLWTHQWRGSPPVWHQPDADGNGRLDAVDLALDLMSQTQSCPSDINHDGVVSVGDMLVLLSDFSERRPN